MKAPKRILCAALCVVLTAAALCAGSLTAFADTFFTEGDFRFAVMSGNVLAVAAYNGDSTDVTLPESVGSRAVTGVYKNSFQNTAVQSVTIPEGYTFIGSFAFSDCQSLTAVALPDSLQTVGIMAFSGCTSLQSIDLSSEDLSTVSFAAFNGCQSLAEVGFGDNLDTLGENAFANCVSLQSLTLPAALTAIPEYAFYNCPLMDVYVPETVTFIGENAFAPANAIVAFEGTAAAEYAADSGADNARILRKIMGDVNFDGVVNVNDVTELQRIAAELRPVYAWEKIVADVNGSKDVSIDDATLIQQFLAEYDVAFVS